MYRSTNIQLQKVDKFGANHTGGFATKHFEDGDIIEMHGVLLFPVKDGEVKNSIGIERAFSIMEILGTEYVLAGIGQFLNHCCQPNTAVMDIIIHVYYKINILDKTS
jgi:hypothetical protein